MTAARTLTEADVEAIADRVAEKLRRGAMSIEEKRTPRKRRQASTEMHERIASVLAKARRYG